MIAECGLCACKASIEILLRDQEGNQLPICTHCIDKIVEIRLNGEADEFTMQDAKDTAQAVSRFYDLRLS